MSIYILLGILCAALIALIVLTAILIDKTDIMDCDGACYQGRRPCECGKRCGK
jgi:hypothetical protein